MNVFIIQVCAATAIRNSATNSSASPQLSDRDAIVRCTKLNPDNKEIATTMLARNTQPMEHPQTKREQKLAAMRREKLRSTLISKFGINVCKPSIASLRK